jgi:hypothetical protein
VDLKDPANVRRLLQQHEPFIPDNFSEEALRAEVSRIGLNHDSTQAVFHVDLGWALCSSSEFVVMRRTEEDKWQIQNVSPFPVGCR